MGDTILQEMFSATGRQAKARFGHWNDFCDDRLFPMVHRQLTDESFSASAEGSRIGHLSATRMSVCSLGVETTSTTIRQQNNISDSIFISLVLKGSVKIDQNDTSRLDGRGDFSFRDQTERWRLAYDGQTDIVAIELSRRHIEGLLGPARRFSGLTVKGDAPSATLARSFLLELMRVGAQLTPDAAERMTAICTDLIVASVAERMAMDVPKPLRATSTVQHAKAYIMAHLSEPDLNSAQVAAAVRVSVRYLQERFRERGCNVSAFIWGQRLEAAARRLSDPAHPHPSLGTLAYGCGFTDQAHFSRRFRDRFGMSPRDYRHAALAAAAGRDAPG